LPSTNLSTKAGQLHILNRRDLLGLPFNLLLLAFAIFWEYSVFTLGRTATLGSSAFISQAIMVGGGLFLIAATLYQVVGRFPHDAYLRGRTFYGLTDQRVIILTTLRPPQRQSIALEVLGPITMTGRRDGRGTVSFGVTPPNRRWWQSAWTLVTVPLALVMISDPEQVAEKIRRAARNVRERR
jgi:hypothetical protein